MSGYEHILVACDGPVVTITINRPEVANALHPPAHAEMAAALDRYAAEDRLRVAVITGAGDRAFCSGSDLKVPDGLGPDEMPATGFAGLAERFDLDKPIIAAVNGHCVGGGLEIALACDLAIAVSHADFGLPEPRVGLAATGGLHRLARQIPLKRAMEIALTGRTFPAKEALGLGLINAVVEPGELEAEVRRWTDSILACAPLALAATKQLIRAGFDQPTLKAAFAARYPALDRMLASTDAREGPRAFVEKRTPRWTGE